MKTKAWRPPTTLTATPVEAPGLRISQGSFFTDSTGAVAGPVALGLSMLKGVEFARAVQPFRIADESDRTLLELTGSTLRGDEELVAMMHAMLAVSRTMYEAYFREMQAHMSDISQETRGAGDTPD
jgi:hypothetical protein